MGEHNLKGKQKVTTTNRRIILIYKNHFI